MSVIERIAQMMGAQIVRADGLQHIFPIDEDGKHDLSVFCWCQPDVEDGVCLHNEMR